MNTSELIERMSRAQAELYYLRVMANANSMGMDSFTKDTVVNCLSKAWECTDNAIVTAAYPNQSHK